jgi:hypothetical protein
MKLKIFLSVLFFFVLFSTGKSQARFSGINDTTPSKAIYFTWINHAWEGTDETQTIANLSFFKWLHDFYGMKLDIYLIDAGTLDEGPNCIGTLFGDDRYGSFSGKRFQRKFPTGLKPISDLAKSFGCSLGMWMGPDGYGKTEEDARKRSQMIVSLCRDFGFKLFKFDACCSDLASENQQYFINTMKECRKYCPDLIVLNHRISFNEEAKKLTTTWLWQGQETYIDVNLPGNATAPHHRSGSMARGLVPGLQRLTEDHGVCISSCLDYWEDDLILQAFNRNLLLAPETYGSPFLLRDSEFPKLARIYNLHRQFDNILVNGLVLPSEKYGENAVSRGDAHTRFITLRNLSWNTKTFAIKLDSSIGLNTSKRLEVRQYHPVECVLGEYTAGQEVKVDVLPFRSALIKISDCSPSGPGIIGCDYDVVKEVPGMPLEIDLAGFPGTKHTIQLIARNHHYKKAIIDGKAYNGLLSGKKIDIVFEGKKLNQAFHRKLADALTVAYPADAEAFYEATCFAADNNALEVRSLMRSGPTEIPSVQNARDAFFKRDVFVEKGIWDKNLFDNDTSTCFKISGVYRNNTDMMFRIDLGSEILLDSLVLINVKGNLPVKAEVSNDLATWESVKITKYGLNLSLQFLSTLKPCRYIRFGNSFESLGEIEGFKHGQQVDRSNWRASNLFGSYAEKGFNKAWSASFTLSEIAKNSYLAVAISGKYSPESIYAAFRIDGKLFGANDRSVSFPSNTWEAPSFTDTKGNYTYYLPLTSDMTGKKIELVVLSNQSKIEKAETQVWITAYPAPYEKKRLLLE